MIEYSLDESFPLCASASVPAGSSMSPAPSFWLCSALRFARASAAIGPQWFSVPFRWLRPHRFIFPNSSILLATFPLWRCSGICLRFRPPNRVGCDTLCGGLSEPWSGADLTAVGRGSVMLLRSSICTNCSTCYAVCQYIRAVCNHLVTYSVNLSYTPAPQRPTRPAGACAVWLTVIA